MVNLIGTYECKADAKGRVMMSSAFKKQLVAVLDDGFVVKRSMFQSCLELYPKKEWDVLIKKTRKKLNPFNRKHNDFLRKFTAGVKMIEMDSAGRILIPKDLCVFAGIEKDVVLSSAVNIIEIWDKDKYEKAVSSDEVDFADLAEEVMGNFDADEIS